jgi:regulatory protein
VIVDGLHPDPRRPGSSRVAVGGKPAWTVPAAVIAELGISVGSTLSGAVAERLDQAADEEGAIRAALRMLERRAHARAELGRKLIGKGHGDGAVHAALLRLDHLGLIDDAAFAEAYVSARAGRGRGAARLRRDLGALGVAEPIIKRALSALGDGVVPDPWRRTLEQAERRATAMRGLPRQVRLRRLGAFLARRGFTGSEANAAVRQLIGVARED